METIRLILCVVIGGSFGTMIGRNVAHERYGSAIVAGIGLIAFFAYTSLVLH